MRSGPRAGRAGVWVPVLFLIGSPLLALAMLNLFLTFGLERWLNQRPERVRIDYDLAIMVRPGTLEIRNLRIRSQSRVDQVWLRARRATVRVDLEALSDRRFVAESFVGRGVSVRYRLRSDTTGVPELEGLPDIPGLSNPPDPAPEDLYPPAEPWSVDLADIRLEDVRELWVQSWRYEGTGRAEGDFRLHGRGDFEVGEAVFDLEDGRVSVVGKPVASEVASQVTLSLARRTDDHLPLLRRLRARVVGAATVADLRFVDLWLPSDWMRLGSAPGTLALDVALADGQLVAGSRVEAVSPNLSARFFSYLATGDGHVRAEVVAGKEGPESRLRVEYRDYALHRGGDGRPLVEGEGLAVTVTSPEVALDRPLERVRYVLELPDSAVPDVSVYDAWLPNKIGLSLLSGRGTLRARLEGSTETERGSGTIVFTGEDLRAEFGDLLLEGDLSMSAKVPTAALDRWEFDIAGTELVMTDVRVRGPKGPDVSTGWWGRLSIPEGTVAMRDDEFLDARLAVRFRDSAPIVAAFAEEKPLPAWVRGVLTVEDVHGSTRLRLADDRLHVPDFQIQGGPIEVRMRLARIERTNRGLLFLRHGKLSLGMRVGAEKEVQVFGAREWFDAERDAY